MPTKSDLQVHSNPTLFAFPEVGRSDFEYRLVGSIYFCGSIFGFSSEIRFNFWGFIQMVYFDSSILVSKSVDQPTDMTSFVNSTDPCLKSRQNNQVYRNKKIPNSSNCLKIPACHQSRSAAVDVVIFIAVIGAFGFLVFPYIKLIFHKIVEIIGAIMYVVKEEVCRAPMIYGSLGLSILCAAVAAWAIVICTSRKCGNPNCRGLRKATEFDIQLETEECVKNSSSSGKDCFKKGLFELPRDHHRELEAELKKMAPPNGRAVLVFRARCGCSVGRMEVPGPKKIRKIKKQG